MAGELIPTGVLPATDAQAEAIKSIAEFGTTVVTEGSALAKYVGKVLGTAPTDVAGIVFGDPLRTIRTIIAGQYDELIDRIHKRRGTSRRQGVSPSLAIPLLQAAYDESRPELQEMWAELIASAEDPSRSHLVRKSFIEKLKQFDPYDALVLRQRHKMHGQPAENLNLYTDVSTRLNIPHLEVQLSVDHLVELGCMFKPAESNIHFKLTPYGEALLRACSD
ncbi:Abi-alpha family protein [Methylovirgula sp. HY1]|uniref:Abi-alpha family protein n=1 Tax=Methylovirgula sp. HY1 TaxID=2822761 RepID=UPI001C5ABE19|nr:Abi-alpha family protein [Methylovirgula sp. HY1]QXX75126.1 hypothetical protein MHY1_01944 [Methylovirgula sp. HY1]